jgi:hypothetical protein
MSTIVLVPDALREAINAKLDAAIEEHPDAQKDREILFSQLLAFSDEHGFIPDFSLSRCENAEPD